MDVRWVHFPLHPETPQQGLPLADLFAGRGLDLEAIHLNMKALMDEEGLPYERRSHTYNSRLAQELAKWGETQPGGEALHGVLYDAYFVSGRNIGDRDVLVELAVAAGLDAGVAGVVLDERTFKAAVDEDWALSQRYGVTGVPTYVAGGRGVVGAQDYNVLERLVTLGGGEPRQSAQ